MSLIKRADLWRNVYEINVGMFTSCDNVGNLISRPMITQKVDPDGVLWFFTSLQSKLVKDLIHWSHANVSFGDPRDTFYVSLNGIARLIQDRQKLQDLWNAMASDWYPRGLEDPQLVLIRFEVSVAEYWDADAGSMVEPQDMVSAAVVQGEHLHPFRHPHRTHLRQL
ncbi:MAG TPA: pyridoxamine 5'-phosphate oxidase family protein [Dongiaceae bacterium]|nr:pyridoxamine 5'-phosphate oxidase family protein [Dongiaceae bacterium]